MDALALLESFLSMRQPTTQKAYRSVWRDWERFLARRDPTRELAVQFISSLRFRPGQVTKKISDATLRHRFHVLRSIYEFLFDMGAVDHNPFRAVKHLLSWRQQVQVRPTKLLPTHIIDVLVRPQKPTTLLERQNDTLLKVLLGGGLRRSEALRIKICDCSFDQERNCEVVLTHTKAGRRQVQPLNAWAGKVLYEYIKYRRLVGALDSDPVFVTISKTGKILGPMSEKTLYRIVKRITGCAPHSTRATAATELKLQGVEDRAVAEFLRHNTTQQVQTYDKRVRELHNVGRKLVFGKKLPLE